MEGERFGDIWDEPEVDSGRRYVIQVKDEGFSASAAVSLRKQSEEKKGLIGFRPRKIQAKVQETETSRPLKDDNESHGRRVPPRRLVVDKLGSIASFVCCFLL